MRFYRQSTLTRIVLTVLALALIGLLVAALSTPTRSYAQAAFGGKIRFVHAVPGAPAVDVFVDDQLAASALTFNNGTRFLNVQPGPHIVKVLVNGEQTAIFQGQVNISADFGLTVVVQGTAQAPEVGAYEDDLAPARPGFIRFSAVHAIKDAPPVDVLLVDGTTLVPLAQGLSYGTPYGSVDIPANSADIVVVPSGANVSSALIKAEKISLVAGTHNTVVALGALDRPAALLLSTPLGMADPATTALVRLVHASPDAPAVDIYVNDTLIAPNIPFGRALPHIALPAGAAKVALRPADAAATTDPIFTADLTLGGGEAFTVSLGGELAKLKATVSVDNIKNLPADKGRLHLINAADDAELRATVSTGAQFENTTVAGFDLASGIYTVFIGKAGVTAMPVDVFLEVSGGVLYNLIWTGNSTTPVIIGATGVTEAPGSVPVAPSASVAEAPTPVPAAPTALPAPPTPGASALLPTLPPPAGATATPVPAQPAPERPRPTATPFGQTGWTGKVDTNPGVNLKIREYPIEDSRTLALAPSQTILIINGIRGPKVDFAAPTPQKTATLAANTLKNLEDLWVFVTWEQEDGGEITGWTKAVFLVVTNDRGKRVLKAEDYAVLPLIAENDFGQIQTGAATPVPAPVERVIGIVNVDVGVNLQLRRLPDIASESLVLLPSGTQLIVTGRTKVASKGGLVGEPESLIWLFVRYQTDAGTTTGWVNSDFVTLTFKGRPFELADVPEIKEPEAGGVQAGGVGIVAPPPMTNVVIATIDKLDPGANLHLRRNPDGGSESLALIPAGAQLQVTARNGDGTWLLTTYNGLTGWINASFVSVTKGGRRYNISDLRDATLPEPTATPIS